MTPFIYYQFLTLRYTSRRNPYTRNMFHELRLATESVANNAKVSCLFNKNRIFLFHKNSHSHSKLDSQIHISHFFIEKHFSERFFFL
jgi:hypothetical protein